MSFPGATYGLPIHSSELLNLVTMVKWNLNARLEKVHGANIPQTLIPKPHDGNINLKVDIKDANPKP